MFWSNTQGWFGKQLEKNILALEEGDRSRIPWIFCVFSERHTASKQVAAQALSHALDHLGFDEIIRVDEQMRQTTSMEWSIDWHKQKIEAFFTPKMSYAERRAVIVFASFNPNGFIRERAVRLMKDYDNTLSYIILRQNDWVVQVRQAASKSFSEKLQKLSDGELLGALPYAEKLKWSSRGSHGEYTRLFFEKLTSTDHRADLMNGLQSSNVRTRRICISALLESATPYTSLALKHLEQESDPFLRSILFRKLCLQKAKMDSTARILLRDKFSANRILALEYLHKASVGDIGDIASTLMLDRNASVRGLARDILHEHRRGFDFRSFYIAALEDNPAAAIAGLGEMGQWVDARHIEIYIGDNRIAVVRAALVSLMGLDAEKYKDIVLEMLKDSRIGIVKTAQQLILKYDIQDYGLIKETFWNTPYEYTKIKCAAILFSASKWNSLIYMLEALSCNIESVQRLTFQAIRKWLFNFNRSYVQISAQQRESIDGLINGLNNKLPDSMKRELLFVLR